MLTKTDIKDLKDLKDLYKRQIELVNENYNFRTEITYKNRRISSLEKELLEMKKLVLKLDTVRKETIKKEINVRIYA